MDSYTLFLKQVLDNNVLNEEVDSLILEQPDALNLITLNWEERLKNNIRYQEFCEKASSMFRSQWNTNKYYHYEFIKNKSFNILVAAECRFPKKYSNDDTKPSVTTINAKPLEQIAKAMFSDMESDFNLSNEFKFTFNMCGPLSCFLCKDYATKFNEKGYMMKKLLQPCISNTRIYDGKNIVNRFVCHIESMFTENFMALLSVKLETRYNYTKDDVKCYRIGGKIQDIVAFQESKLCTPRSINTGHLIDVDSILSNAELEAQNSNTEMDDKMGNILKLPESIVEFDIGVPLNKRRREDLELLNGETQNKNSKLDDKSFNIFKLPELNSEFEIALPLNKKQCIEEDLEVEEKEEFIF